jgi:hypothetical protein
MNKAQLIREIGIFFLLGFVPIGAHPSAITADRLAGDRHPDHQKRGSRAGFPSPLTPIRADSPRRFSRELAIPRRTCARSAYWRPSLGGEYLSSGSRSFVYILSLPDCTRANTLPDCPAIAPTISPDSEEVRSPAAKCLHSDRTDFMGVRLCLL